MDAATTNHQRLSQHGTGYDSSFPVSANFCSIAALSLSLHLRADRESAFDILQIIEPHCPPDLAKRMYINRKYNEHYIVRVVFKGLSDKIFDAFESFQKFFGANKFAVQESDNGTLTAEWHKIEKEQVLNNQDLVRISMVIRR